MTTPIRLSVAALAASTAVLVGAAERAADYFEPTEQMVTLGASCTFSDEVGVVLQSNWQTRHWVKVEGKTTEFNGEARMSDPGWFQEFVSGDLSVTMRLRRTGDRGDGVPMVGDIDVTWKGRKKTFTVKGGCGA